MVCELGWEPGEKDAPSIPSPRRGAGPSSWQGGQQQESLGSPAEPAAEALGSSLPKLGKEKGHPASSTLPSGYLYAAGMGAGRRGLGGWSGA